MERSVNNRINQAPGIGVQDQITVSNSGTRAVLVCGELADIDHLAGLSHQLLIQPGINRYILKAIAPQPLPIGSPVNSNEMQIEASIPFSVDGINTLYWTIAGCNTGERIVDHDLIEQQRQIIVQINSDPKYQPQSGQDLLAFAMRTNPWLEELAFLTITPDNFEKYYQSLRRLYHQAFEAYPYDVVEAIKSSCGENIFVAAVAEINGQQEIISITGAEFMTILGIPIAEVGDSASLTNLKGFGAVMKRLLMQTMHEAGRTPALLFTDSRIADDGAVLKANRRAGFILDPRVILPWHNAISSTSRDHGQTKQITSPIGLIPVENMTMTFADRQRVLDIIDNYGGII